jgi:hypothetical protein
LLQIGAAIEKAYLEAKKIEKNSSSGFDYFLSEQFGDATVRQKLRKPQPHTPVVDVKTQISNTVRADNPNSKCIEYLERFKAAFDRIADSWQAIRDPNTVLPQGRVNYFKAHLIHLSDLYDRALNYLYEGSEGKGLSDCSDSRVTQFNDFLSRLREYHIYSWDAIKKFMESFGNIK